MSEQNHKRKLLVIIAWFFIPLAIAITWYKLLPEDYRPASMTNNGELLNPVFSLGAFDYQTVDGKRYSGKDVESIWTLVHFVVGDCDEACSESLYNTRQMRISFGKDIDRIARLAVVEGALDSVSNMKMWASHPDLTVVKANGNGIGTQIKQHRSGFDRKSNAVFLLDPLGNVVMRFPASLETKLMKQDIRKLLKLSHIG